MLQLCSRAVPKVLQHIQSLLVSSSRSLMDLRFLVSSLNDFAPLSLAESWDNVGLLVEPSPPHVVNILFLTNDLTADVMDEALSCQADMILSYHPPIFRPLKRISWNSWKERLLIQALEQRVAIYSPHTAFDAISHGVNDWLAKGLGDCTTVPLHPSTSPSYPGDRSHRVEFTVDSAKDLESVLPALHAIAGVSVSTFQTRANGAEKMRVILKVSPATLDPVTDVLSKDCVLYESVEISSLLKPYLPNTGMGRLCTLQESAPLKTIVERIKKHMGLAHLRLALGAGATLDTNVTVAAVCAGSGSTVLQGVDADLYVTGEMSHHDVLDAASQGTSVILCKHSNTERGFLRDLHGILDARFEGTVRVVMSERDRDPLEVV